MKITCSVKIKFKTGNETHWDQEKNGENHNKLYSQKNKCHSFQSRSNKEKKTIKFVNKI